MDNTIESLGLVKYINPKLMVVTFPDLSATGSNYLFLKAHERLNSFWKEQGVAHLDLLPLFINRPARSLTVNRHDAHPNELAHRIAADAVEGFIVGNPQPRPPEPIFDR